MGFFLCALLIFLHQSVSVFPMLDPIDFLSLQIIQKSLDDMPGSNYFASWDFMVDPCNFASVYCDSDKVIALNLGDPRAGTPGLTGRLDPAIGKLTSLAEFTVIYRLSIKGKDITELIQSGREKLDSIPSGSSIGSGDGAAVPAAEAKKHEKMTEKEEFNDDTGFNFFE